MSASPQVSLALRAAQERVWLCEPTRLQLAVARVLSYPTCPTSRELAEEHKRRMDAAKNCAANAIESRWTDADLTRQAAGSKAVHGVKGRVAVIPVHGPVEQRLSSELLKSGGTGLDEVHAALDSALADKQVGAIVFHVDSPGGSSYGTEELSDRIHDIRAQKKTYAIADSMAASAGYWIASAAETMIVTGGGDVGSVGVFCLHVDQSKALELSGVKVTMVSSGKYKGEMAPFRPLSEDSHSHLQARVDETHDKFIAALKRNRGVSAGHVREKFGQGRLMGADAALENGLVDKIMTFSELIDRLTGRGASTGDTKADAGPSVEMLRLRHAWEKQKIEAGK